MHSAHGWCKVNRVIMHLEVQCRQQDKKGHYAHSTTVQPTEKRVIMHSLHRKKGHYALRTWQVPEKKGHYALRSAVQVARSKGSLCTLCIGKRVIMHFVYR